MPKNTWQWVFNAYYFATAFISVSLISIANCEAENLAAGQARIISMSDGTFRVQFQPRMSAKKDVEVHDKEGRLLGIMDKESLFEVQIDRAKLEASITRDGIDLQKLLGALGYLQEKANKTWVSINMPYEVHDANSGEVIGHGQDAYIALNQFIESHDVTPVGVTTVEPANPAAAQTAQRFERVLEERGVINEPPRAPVARPTRPEPPARPPRKADGSGQTAFDNTEGGFFSPPLCGCREKVCTIRSPVGKRTDPVSGKQSYHEGTDISADTGTEVRATADGCMVSKTHAFGGGYGNSIYLGHDQKNKLQTHYAHLSRLSEKALKGKAPVCFQRGEVLGYVGSTGHATGPHLHFAIYLEGRAQPPGPMMAAFDTKALNLSCADLNVFNQELTSKRATQLQKFLADKTKGVPVQVQTSNPVAN